MSSSSTSRAVRRRAVGMIGSTLKLALALILLALSAFCIHGVMEATHTFGLDPNGDHVYEDFAWESRQDDLVQPDHGKTTNGIGMQLAFVPAGQFIMGSPAAETLRGADETPHRVRITRPFYLGVHEVTVGQFRKFVEETGYQTEIEALPRPQGTRSNAHPVASDSLVNWQHPGYPQEDNHPVVFVTWNDAAEFCRWLSRREGCSYRLPTEAEWEFACRAGSLAPYAISVKPGESAMNVRALSSHASSGTVCFGDDGYEQTSPVGSFRPNAFGLCDMHGNVWEWCSDWYAEDYYESAATNDPEGPSDGTQRVLRGGSYFHSPGAARCARRSAREPRLPLNHVGFRVVRETVAGN